MEIILADKAGFCFGVRRAINTAFEAASKGPVYCLGPLIHNPQEVARLSSAGVRTVEDLGALSPGDVLIIRSHGVPPAVLQEALRKGLSVIDLTCPFVAKAQRHAETLGKEGYQVIVVGERDHPEVKSILGYGGTHAAAVERPDDLAGLAIAPRVGVVVQTTQAYGNFAEIVLRLLNLTNELRVFNTICLSTAERQEAVTALSRTVDVMIVVGGRNSANTTRLASLCRAEGCTAHHIEQASEIVPEWVRGVARVGVTAGASTPDWVIEAVVQRLRDLGQST